MLCHGCDHEPCCRRALAIATREATVAERANSEAREKLIQIERQRMETIRRMQPTDALSVEQTLRMLFDAALSSEKMKITSFVDVTSEGYVDLLKIFLSLKGYPMPTGYVLEKTDEAPKSAHFNLRVDFGDEKPPLAGKVTVGQVGDVWKISAVKVPGLRD
jgi:hypothetical protein